MKDELREKIALKLSPHLSRFFKINPDVDDIAAERERALSIADEILAILPAQPDVSGLVGALDQRILILERAEKGEGLSVEPNATEIGCAKEDLADELLDHWAEIRQALTLSATPEEKS